MIKHVEQLLKNEIGVSGFLDWLARHFPLIDELEDTPQDPEWHGEGNVRIHTEMVLTELLKDLPNHADLSTDHIHALIIGAALHDIGKTRVTREKELAGKVRIVSPRHAETGRSYSALPLAGFEDVNDTVYEWTLGIIGYHHHPRKLISGRISKGKFARIARSIPLRLLEIFEYADIRGRICADPTEQLETVDLFRLEAESMGYWENDPYAGWLDRIENEFEITAPEESSYVFDAAKHLFENGEIQTLEEAIGKTWDTRSSHGRLIILCGPSGSGKSRWIQNHDSDRVVSLDDLRIEISGRRDRQADNGKVAQLAKERLKEGLRAKETIIYDATTLRTDGRSSLVSLAHQYHSASGIVRFAVDPDELNRRNRSRRHQVPSKVLDRQLDRFQWPDLWEAQRVITHRWSSS